MATAAWTSSLLLGTDEKITWYENRVGQFALATTITGQQDDVLRVVVSHRGRTGDTEAELATFELLFEESARIR